MRQGKNVEKLLPDALPPPYGRPYTLVIDLSALVYKDVTVRLTLTPADGSENSEETPRRRLFPAEGI